METKKWTVRIYLAEDGDDTSAQAVLITRGGGRLDGLGRSHRDPADEAVPEIGDKLATSRALTALAASLTAITRHAIS
ncbi:dsRBD fold-containing protein [Nonomuraea zeae]|uniref:DUF1876 domain-containing protein n=1 Tax=Nonomuraea zeae TaxID=1642303 RepID=A0A5S4HF05_9ACTN|nr:dsRBD fold-containing protein [Nonomuraea zeae]TMR37510.1 DUF1876 domain-containing protein [Nonomuraea zeae]